MILNKFNLLQTAFSSTFFKQVNLTKKKRFLLFYVGYHASKIQENNYVTYDNVIPPF